MRTLNLIASFLWIYVIYYCLNNPLFVHVELFSGIMFSLKSTALGSFFALLSAFGLLMISVVMFKEKQTNSFYALLQLLNASLFLILYANDYLLFFIGWEIMGLSSYFLLSFTLSKEALIKYIIFTMTSAFALLGAILMLYFKSHSFLYSDMNFAFLELHSTQQYILIALMLLAMFIKLGAIGVHHWLVDAYELSTNSFTPYLSAVVSKMSVYGVIIFLINVIDFGSNTIVPLSYMLAFMGVLSSIIATFKAVNEESPKRLLAYSSIAQLGYILTALSLSEAFGGALYHSLIHTLAKLLLFINIAGVIAVTSKTTFSSLGGLIYKMPQSFILLLIGIITLAGMPPLGGFNSKFLIYASLTDGKYLLILSAMMFASASAFLYIYKLIYGIYLGHPTSKKVENSKESSYLFLIPQYIVALALVYLGAYPSGIVPYLNTILKELHVKTLAYSTPAELITPIASYNGLVVMGAFVILFVLLLAFVTALRSRKKESCNRFDIAYCGEVPNEATHLHYGYSMGKELSRVGFIRTILSNSTKGFYGFLASQTYSFAQVIRKLYTGNIQINFQLAVIFVIILLWWSQR